MWPNGGWGLVQIFWGWDMCSNRIGIKGFVWTQTFRWKLISVPLSFCESRLHNFLSWSLPCYPNPCTPDLQGYVSIPGDSWLKHRETQYCMSLSMNIFWSCSSSENSWLFILAQKSYYLSLLLPRCFYDQHLLSGASPSWYPEPWNLFLSGRAEVKRYLDGLKFLLQWLQLLVGKLYFLGLVAIQVSWWQCTREKLSPLYSDPKPMAGPFIQDARIRIPAIKRQKICIPFFKLSF